MQPSRRTVLGGAAATLALAWAAPRADATGLSPLASSPSCVLDPHADKTDLRGIWIASVTNIDWPTPTRPDRRRSSRPSSSLVDDLAVAQHYNAVVVQVRPTADAFWPSPFEPWSQYLTGTQGERPRLRPAGVRGRRGPLAATWSSTPGSTRTGSPMTHDRRRRASSPTHPARVHPDWVVPYGGKLYYNPGIPEVRDFVEDAMMDAVTRYDIDAVHFDDYFYPYPVVGQTFHDDAHVRAVRRGPVPRRLAARQHRPADQRDGLGASRRPSRGSSSASARSGSGATQAPTRAGSETQAGVQTYDDLYADTRQVGPRGLDRLHRARRSTGTSASPPPTTTTLVDWWSNVVARHATCTSTSGRPPTRSARPRSRPSGTTPQELSNHLFFNRTRPEVDGNIYFSAKDVRANRLDGMGIVGRDWYRHPALVPPMPWIDASGPKAPKDLSASVGGSGTTVRWRAGDSTTVSYAVYRIPVTDQRVKPDDCVVADATNLVATMRAVSGYQTWTDASAGGQRYTYVITGLDRTWNESVPQQVTPS